MSVAQISASEYGAFVAAFIKSKAAPDIDLFQLCKLCELLSIGNAAAYAATYSDFIEPATADEVEREALRMLTNPAEILKRFLGPLAYNCIANDGRAWIGLKEVQQSDLETLIEMEAKARYYVDALRAEAKRREENDLAFRDVGPLEHITWAEACERCKAAGGDRIIFATYYVDESDLMTDYFGGRQVREVVIGFGKGKRESFSQLRKAAALFEPTKDFGPGCGIFAARSVWDHDHTDAEAIAASQYHDSRGNYWKGHYSRFSDSPEFATRAELDAWIAENPLGRGNSYSISVDGEKAIEHRENYSMGGGNYLGYSRYGGWKVKSNPLQYCSGSGLVEFFEPPRRVANSKATKPAPATPRQPAKDPAPPVESPDYDAWLDWI